MDQESKSDSRRAAFNSTIKSKCSLAEKTFHEIGGAAMEFDLDAGLCKSTAHPIPYFKYRAQEDTIIKPVRLRISWNEKDGYKREVTQAITKPQQRGFCDTNKFRYKISPKEDVVISRLVVNIDDITAAIDELLTEANRYYLLYCTPI